MHLRFSVADFLHPRAFDRRASGWSRQELGLINSMANYTHVFAFHYSLNAAYSVDFTSHHQNRIWRCLGVIQSLQNPSYLSPGRFQDAANSYLYVPVPVHVGYVRNHGQDEL